MNNINSRRDWFIKLELQSSQKIGRMENSNAGHALFICTGSASGLKNIKYFYDKFTFILNAK